MFVCSWDQIWLEDLDTLRWEEREKERERQEQEVGGRAEEIRDVMSIMGSLTDRERRKTDN